MLLMAELLRLSYAQLRSGGPGSLPADTPHLRLYNTMLGAPLCRWDQGLGSEARSHVQDHRSQSSCMVQSVWSQGSAPGTCALYRRRGRPASQCTHFTDELGCGLGSDLVTGRDWCPGRVWGPEHWKAGFAASAAPLCVPPLPPTRWLAYVLLLLLELLVCLFTLLGLAKQSKWLVIV